MHRGSRIVLVLAVVMTAALLTAACAPKGPKYVDAGVQYNRNSVLTLMDSADISSLASTPASDAPELRRTALNQLRARSESAAVASDLLATTFPVDTRGVPVYVERASVDGTPAVVVVEAAGPRGGKLTTKRLWAIDLKGDVIVVGTK